jgi:hypothetical protein
MHQVFRNSPGSLAIFAAIRRTYSHAARHKGDRLRSGRPPTQFFVSLNCSPESSGSSFSNFLSVARKWGAILGLYTLDNNLLEIGPFVLGCGRI